MPSVRPQMHTNKSNTFNMASFRYCTDGRYSFCLLGTGRVEFYYSCHLLIQYEQNTSSCTTKCAYPVSVFMLRTLNSYTHTSFWTPIQTTPSALPSPRLSALNDTSQHLLSLVCRTNPVFHASSITHTHTQTRLPLRYTFLYIHMHKCSDVSKTQHNYTTPCSYHVLVRVFKEPVTIWTWIGYKWLRIDDDCL
jgi:hypothetical protein